MIDWLHGQNSPKTRQAYEDAWRMLLESCQRDPDQVTPEDVRGWVAGMRERGNAPATINQRLSAISSFYAYYGMTNPVTVKRPKVSLYGKAHHLDAEQARALLGAIDRRTVQGKRDYALFLFYIATGRRNGEVRKLRWGDFEVSEKRVTYRYTGKGKDEKYELPLEIYGAILEYLEAAGRLPMSLGDFIFTPMTGENQPLCGNQVRKLLRKYLKLAGLDPAKIRVHDLRHTAAMLRLQSGQNMEQIRDFLNHSSLVMTSLYLHRLEGRKDTAWLTVREMLGL